MAAEPRIGPVERTDEPWRAGFLAAERRAAPFIRAVEEPDAGKFELGDDGRHLVHIGRARAPEPAARHRVEERHGRMRGARKPGEAVVAQRAGARTGLAGVAERSAIAHIDHRTRNEIGGAHGDSLSATVTLMHAAA